MNDEERTQVYQELLRTLRDNNLEWVAEQVEEQIRLGKTVEKEVQTLKETDQTMALSLSDGDLISLRKGPTAKFPVTQDYEPLERLLLLVEAIERTVVNTSLMEMEVMQTFGKEMLNLQDIQFYPEVPTFEPKTITRQITSLRTEKSIALKEILDKLRLEA